MERKTIVILANKYPNAIEPNVNVFTQQIVWSLADQGQTCHVICPVAINYNPKYIKFPKCKTETTESGNQINIYHPQYMGLGQNGDILLKERVKITTELYLLAAEKILKKILIRDNNPRIFAEFLCPAGVAAAKIGKKYKLRAYMQCGEATYQGDSRYGNSYLKKNLDGLEGVIALSGQNKDYLLEAGVINSNKIIVLPSGYRKSRIYPRDKMIARRKLSLPEDKFIVGYCGSYDERKGIMRLQEAVDRIEDQDIVFAACGKGELKPNSRKCVFTGPINHADLAWFYSALDVFAFPTYHEGCCTAIVEAIACGCPIISSDRAFNYEICDETNSILIEPDDIEALKNSIIRLKKDAQYRNKLSEGSLKKSEDLSLDEKAKKVLQFMQ